MYRNNYYNILVHFVRNIDFDIDLDSIRLFSWRFWQQRRRLIFEWGVAYLFV